MVINRGVVGAERCAKMESLQVEVQAQGAAGEPSQCGNVFSVIQVNPLIFGADGLHCWLISMAAEKRCLLDSDFAEDLGTI